jgi:hypothetical protein
MDLPTVSIRGNPNPLRRSARDYDRLPAALAGLHLVAFSVLLVRRAADFAAVRDSL